MLICEGPDKVAADTSSGLFAALEMVPLVGGILLVVATILVATYYVTSLDSGTYALAEFVSAPRKAGPWFRVVLVVSIAAVATVLLSIGGTSVVDTVQTGTIIGAFPFSFIIFLMIANLIRRLVTRTKDSRRPEKEINDPNPRPEDDYVDEHGLPTGEMPILTDTSVADSRRPSTAPDEDPMKGGHA